MRFKVSTKNQEYIQRNKILTGFNGKEPIVKPCDPKTKAFFIQENNCDCVANLYESKGRPMLRFIHEKDIQPCGWVTVKIDDYYLVTLKINKCLMLILKLTIYH